MAYCTNCGVELKTNTNFCTACGNKVERIHEKNVEAHKEKIDKGELDSLKDEISNNVTIKTKKARFKNRTSEKVFNDTDFENNNNASLDIKKPSRKLIVIYLLISIILFMFGGGSDEIIGVEIFSFIILLIYGFRYKKEKPFNWILKIVLILQLVLAFSVFITQAEYLFDNLFILVTVLSLLALFIVNILILIRGNKI